MHAIWKGAVNFGLVSIPVAVYPSVRTEELKFRMLRKSDLSPIKYKRVAEVDGQEVPYDQIIKGYEYEKGAFVPLAEQGFKRARAAGVHSIEIIDFVRQTEIDPLFYDKPYYLQPEKGGAHAYGLLREALVESGVVGVGKVVIRSKQYLAAIRPQGRLLVLELLHFADELVDAGTIQAPAEATANPKEMELAKTLIGSMTSQWNPGKYADDYRSALLEVIEEKIRGGAKAGVKRAPAARLPGNVVNVMDMLERSLKETGRKPRAKAARRKKAA